MNSKEFNQVIQASLEKVAFILKNFGWLELFPYKYVLELSKAHKQGGEEAIWNIIIDDSNNAELLDSLVRDTGCINSLKTRSHIISRGIEHHKNKDYVSSVPLLLSQIEGIIWDLGVEKKIVENKPNSKFKLDPDGNYVFDRNGNKIIEWNLIELIQELFGNKSRFAIHAINEVYSKEFRHPVLHGRKIDYNDPKNSAMLVMMVYTLIEKTRNETKNKTKAGFK